MQRGSESFDVVEKRAPDEASLQEVVRANPQLLPAEDLGLGEGDLIVVGRETYLASGAIDLLCLSRMGDLVLVEFKTGPQNPDFRHALAQVIDYGADLWRMSVEDFDRGVVQRYLSGAYVDSSSAGVHDLAGLLSVAGLTPVEAEAATDRLDHALKTGDFTFVVAAQKFVPAMVASVAYLNAAAHQGRYYLVEVVRLEGADVVAHAAQVVAAPLSVGRSKPSAESQADEAGFVAELTDPEHRESMQTLLATVRALGVAISWGSRGASFRIDLPDRAHPLSIGWVLPPGVNYKNARDVTFGVEEAHRETLGAAGLAIDAFMRVVGEIPGAKAITQPHGVTLDPTTLVTHTDMVTTALGNLLEAVSGKP